MALRIGPYKLRNNIGLAPMAGVTDLPFRKLCMELGAGFAAGEMLTSDVSLWRTAKSRRRMDHTDEPEPRIVQIAGGDPEDMAQAAALNVAHGAQIIDLNMGCPAKKVCRKVAGSALMRDPGLIRAILQATVAAVAAPVTLKLRTGWDLGHRNAVEVAELAESEGICAIAVHGRTRAQRFEGVAEFDTVGAVKRAVSIPVLANGDIATPERAAWVLEHTGADGLLIGRAAQGRPWVFREITQYLEHGVSPTTLDAAELSDIMLRHLDELHRFYGDSTGVRIARKHIGWYCEGRPDAATFRARVMRVESAERQRAIVADYFSSSSEATAA
jgi:tRNA-dihydrouridine synthase B